MPNEFGSIYSAAGGVHLNAATGFDDTSYHVSLPSNRAELWFAMESERFRRPVLRQLHSERRVILEERGQRIDSSPSGAFLEQFQVRFFWVFFCAQGGGVPAGACERRRRGVQARAFGNNYRRPVIGYRRDIERLRRADVAAFLQRHYTPANLAVGIAGDITVEEAERLAYKYFGDWHADAAGAPDTGALRDDSAVPLAMAAPARGASQVEVSAAEALLYRGQGGGDAAEAALGRRAQADASARPANLETRSAMAVPSVIGPAAHVCFYRPAAAVEGVPLALDAVGDVLAGSRSSRAYRTLVATGALLLQVVAPPAHVLLDLASMQMALAGQRPRQCPPDAELAQVAAWRRALQAHSPPTSTSVHCGSWRCRAPAAARPLRPPRAASSWSRCCRNRSAARSWRASSSPRRCGGLRQLMHTPEAGACQISGTVPRTCRRRLWHLPCGVGNWGARGCA